MLHRNGDKEEKVQLHDDYDDGDADDATEKWSSRRGNCYGLTVCVDMCLRNVCSVSANYTCSCYAVYMCTALSMFPCLWVNNVCMRVRVRLRVVSVSIRPREHSSACGESSSIVCTLASVARIK